MSKKDSIRTVDLDEVLDAMMASDWKQQKNTRRVESGECGITVKTYGYVQDNCYLHGSV